MSSPAARRSWGGRAAAQPELAFLVEGVRRFLLGRLTGSPGGLDELKPACGQLRQVVVTLR